MSIGSDIRLDIVQPQLMPQMAIPEFLVRVKFRESMGTGWRQRASQVSLSSSHTLSVKKDMYKNSPKLNSALVNKDSDEQQCNEGKQAMQWINSDSSSDDTAEQGDACPSQPAEGRQEEEEADDEVGQTDLVTHDWLKVLLPRTRSRTRRGKTEEEARPQAEGEEEEQMQGLT